MEPIFQAEFIRQATDLGTVCPMFKKTFTAKRGVRRAVLQASALGFYEAYLNAKRVGNFIFAPGWTSYETRLQYQTYDVTDLLKSENELSIWVGLGRRFHNRKNEELPFLNANESAVIACLMLEYENGETEYIATGEDWGVYRSGVLYSDIYNGETYDYNATPGETLPCKIVPVSKRILLSEEGEETHEMDRIAAAKLIKTPLGETVIDFGQEITGYVEFRLKGEKGHEYILDHAEFPDKNGNFYTENLRAAKCRVTVIADGKEHLYKPHFSFQGFRFIRLTGFDENEIALSDFTAVAVYSDMKRTGYFACGDPLVQRLYENIVWGQRGNFLDIPTDCPQRDERMGWTGDCQVFARTASINYDTSLFYRKWLHDLSADQAPNGCVPHIIPSGWDGAGGSAAWGDVAVILPYQLYLAYGDATILKEQFESMKKWIAFIESQCSEKGLWDQGEHFGDWLSLDAGNEACGGFTDKNLIATAMFAYSTELLIKMGRVLGKDVTYYEKLYPVIVKAYQKHFLNTGKTEHETQTANVLALYFRLTDDPAREAKKLTDDIEACGHLKTGFVGTPYLLHVLTDIGRNDLAYKLLLRKEFPSWLYPVTMGATTMWERWDGMKKDRSFATPGMNSFNHYAYGAVGDWIFGEVAGINPEEAEPAYKHILFTPHPNKELCFVKAHIDTKYGEVSSAWRYTGDGDQCEIELVVPDGAHATFIFAGESKELQSGSYTFWVQA